MFSVIRSAKITGAFRERILPDLINFNMQRFFRPYINHIIAERIVSTVFEEIKGDMKKGGIVEPNSHLSKPFKFTAKISCSDSTQKSWRRPVPYITFIFKRLGPAKVL